MPKSKHRRKNKERPRPRNVDGPPVSPTPSPRWVPVTGLSLLGFAVVIILVGYLDPVARQLVDFPLVGSNITLVTGFVLLLSGMVVLTRWQ